MTSQFSPKVSQILAFSREEAARLASRSVLPEHLLLGMLRDKTGSIHELFITSDINYKTIKNELEQKVREDNFMQPLRTYELVLNEKASNILKLAVLEARIQARQMVDEQHLLLAILHDHVNNGAKEILEQNNMNYEEAAAYFRQKAGQTQDGIDIPDNEEVEDDGLMNDNGNDQSKSRRNGTTTETRKPSGKTPVLDNFGTDLTKAAAEGKLDPVVGREREIQRRDAQPYLKRKERIRDQHLRLHGEIRHGDGADERGVLDERNKLAGQRRQHRCYHPEPRNQPRSGKRRSHLHADNGA